MAAAAAARFLVGLLAAVLLGPGVGQAAGLPAYLGFLPGKLVLRTPEFQDWDYAQIPPYEDPAPANRHEGKHWHILGELKVPVSDRAAAWESVKADFLGAGWEVSKILTTGTYTVALHYARAGTDAWASVDFTSTPSIGMTVIETAPLPQALVLPQPAATPEKILPGKDFPFLPPVAVPGTKPGGGGHDPGPFRVNLPGQEQPELVATGFTHRSYHPPANFSAYEWVHLYPAGLAKAGWTVVSVIRAEAIVAHYGLNGRNIWAYLHMNADGYDIVVGDEGGGEGGLRSDLAKQCHAVLLGVLFDFNKATLKPQSDAVLEQVRALLGKDAKLHAEIQGHTDNVGTPEYNITLSEARAAAVVAWLAAHGVAAERLSAKGYGLTMPVADNRTDEGRAKNRRVEIADPACKPKPH